MAIVLVVWGKALKKSLLTFGASTDQLIPTNNIDFDIGATYKTCTAKEQCRIAI